jgi:endonuclease/exonuclease/phosphatase family metal-dependent hydrolase
MADHRGIVVGALTWNLFHGRDFPPNPELRTWRSRLLRTEERDATHAQVNRSLRAEFAEVLAELAWEIALLQEAPAPWLDELARRSRAKGDLVLTSRRLVPPVQRALAEWNPDLIASWEGGSNMVLVRAPARIAETRRLTVATHPEHRRMLFARIAAPGGRELCVANVHLSTDVRQARSEAERAAAWAVHWAGAAPLVFGGDLNLRPALTPEPFDLLRDRLGLAPPTSNRAIDHLLARGLRLVEPPTALPPEAREREQADGLRIRLSDHAPVAASFGMR